MLSGLLTTDYWSAGGSHSLSPVELWAAAPSAMTLATFARIRLTSGIGCYLWSRSGA